MLIGLPAGVALVVLSEALLATLLQYGEFTPRDVEMAGKSLVAFSLGLPALILVKVLTPGFYARQDTKTPAKIAVISVGVNILFSLLLVMPMAHTGLALALTISAYVNVGLLYHTLKKQGVYQLHTGWLAFFIKVVAACSGMGALLIVFTGELSLWIDASLLERVSRLSILILAGALVYFLLVFLLRIPVKAMLRESRTK